MIDLGTARDMLACIRDDFERVSALQRAAGLIDAALGELVAAERRNLAPLPISLVERGLLRRSKN